MIRTVSIPICTLAEIMIAFVAKRSNFCRRQRSSLCAQGVLNSRYRTFESASSAFHSRSLQNRASDKTRNQRAESGGYGVSCVGRHEPTCCIRLTSGTAKVTIDKTERNVSWNEGSKNSAGRHTSKAIAAAPRQFKVSARRETTGANSTTANMKADRATEASAPTAIVYAHNRPAENMTWRSLRLVSQRTTAKTRPPIKAICSPLITRT